jgi:hypothetical protein
VSAPGRPELDELVLGADPDAWRAIGTTVDDEGVAPVGGVRLRFTGEGGGLLRWSLRHLRTTDLDGLPTSRSEQPPPDPVDHPLGLIAVDHVVATTRDLQRSCARLLAAGLDHRDAPNAPQEFFVVGPALLELAETEERDDGFWGLTLVVSDLDAAKQRLGDALGDVRDAVQPGRRIATVRQEAGLGLPVALMTPRQ